MQHTHTRYTQTDLVRDLSLNFFTRGSSRLLLFCGSFQRALFIELAMALQFIAPVENPPVRSFTATVLLLLRFSFFLTSSCSGRIPNFPFPFSKQTHQTKRFTQAFFLPPFFFCSSSVVTHAHLLFFASPCASLHLPRVNLLARAVILLHLEKLRDFLLFYLRTFTSCFFSGELLLYFSPEQKQDKTNQRTRANPLRFLYFYLLPSLRCLKCDK